MKTDLDELSPKEIVSELDRYIVGQKKAKKAVAIALRNRLRRQKLSEELRNEIAPKNIIMIGPTGVGKTEIARRLAKLCRAPFIKVEATKYTEVGYVGRDVESMVRDLTSVSVNMVKAELQEGHKEEAEKRVEDELINLLLPSIENRTKVTSEDNGEKLGKSESENGTREVFKKRLQDGELEEKIVEVNVTKSSSPAIEIFAGQNFEEMNLDFGNLGNMFGGGKKKSKKVPIKRARQILMAQEVDKLVDMDHVSEIAINRVQQMGIIFLDEIDKVSSKGTRTGNDVSREGVQRDILPIVEGSTVNTKWGIVDTSHVLFIAAGAFHMSKPADLIPELQGRFPIRVELTALGTEDFKNILTKPRNALITQYTALIGTENVTLEFTESAINSISQMAAEVNSRTENIGARRLHTILELLLEDLSFNAPELKGQTVEITDDYVNEKLKDVIEDRDLAQYIL